MSLAKWDFTNIAISLWLSVKPVSITLLLWKESGLFVRIKSVVDICVFVMQISFVIHPDIFWEEKSKILKKNDIFTKKVSRKNIFKVVQVDWDGWSDFNWVQLFLSDFE